MRIGVIADIHGNLDALDAVLAALAREGVTRIVNLGDSLSGPLDAAATADRLLALDLPTVRGNHDRALVEQTADQMGNWERWIYSELAPAHLNWLAALPATLTVDGILCCHGTPASDTENWLHDRGPDQHMFAVDAARAEAPAKAIRSPVILCAHTHIPAAVRLSGGRMVINPGSVGCPAYLDIRFDPPFRMETGSPDARYAIVEDTAGGWTAKLCAVPYDPSRMVDLAAARGADTWITPLRTGRAS